MATLSASSSSSSKVFATAAKLLPDSKPLSGPGDFLSASKQEHLQEEQQNLFPEDETKRKQLVPESPPKKVRKLAASEAQKGAVKKSKKAQKAKKCDDLDVEEFIEYDKLPALDSVVLAPGIKVEATAVKVGDKLYSQFPDRKSWRPFKVKMADEQQEIHWKYKKSIKDPIMRLKLAGDPEVVKKSTIRVNPISCPERGVSFRSRGSRISEKSWIVQHRDIEGRRHDRAFNCGKHVDLQDPEGERDEKARARCMAVAVEWLREQRRKVETQRQEEGKPKKKVHESVRESGVRGVSWYRAAKHPHLAGWTASISSKSFCGGAGGANTGGRVVTRRFKLDKREYEGDPAGLEEELENLRQRAVAQRKLWEKEVFVFQETKEEKPTQTLTEDMPQAGRGENQAGDHDRQEKLQYAPSAFRNKMKGNEMDTFKPIGKKSYVLEKSKLVQQKQTSKKLTLVDATNSIAGDLDKQRLHPRKPKNREAKSTSLASKQSFVVKKEGAKSNSVNKDNKKTLSTSPTSKKRLKNKRGIESPKMHTSALKGQPDSMIFSTAANKSVSTRSLSFQMFLNTHEYENDPKGLQEALGELRQQPAIAQRNASKEGAFFRHAARSEQKKQQEKVEVSK
ncbi:unnamed protein product [Amoebophrya sp. A120]|nr:unnamed protein product [Amoebophrya sp. A120]|eukprot:GSA120T00019098001.1